MINAQCIGVAAKIVHVRIPAFGRLYSCVEELCVYASVLAKIINGLKLKQPLSKWEGHRRGVFPCGKSFAYNMCASFVWERVCRSACR